MSSFMKSKKKSIVLAACAITNAQHVKASNANTHILPNIALDSGYIQSNCGPTFLIRGGTQEDGTMGSTTRSGKKGSYKKDHLGESTSKRKKKKKRKSKATEATNVKSDIDENVEQGNSKEDSNEKKTKASSSSSKSVPVDTNEPISEQSPKAETNSSQQSERIPTQPEPEQKLESQPQQSKDDLIEEIINSTDLYQILSLDKSEKSTLTSMQITKAYRRRAVRTHPDKLNGDRRAFDKVSEAYDVLSDESKKKIYDKFGLEAVKDPDFMARAASRGMSGAFSGVQDEILKSFFGAGARASDGFSRMSSQLRKNKDVKYELEVSLEDMYRGAAHREVNISQPNGPKMVSLDIPAGIVPGSSIRLSGVVDHVASATPGDVVFIVRQRGHAIFTRKGHDLAVEVKLSLSEAICGFERQIVHLDGRHVNITGPMRTSAYNDNIGAPSAIQTGDVHMLKGEGMPKPGENSFIDGDENDEDVEERCKRYGDLYVQYTIEMPNANEANLNKLSPTERQTLGDLLDKLQGRKARNLINDDCSKLRSLQRARASDFGRASGIAEPQNDGDEHMHTEEDDQVGGHGFQSHFFSRGSSPFTRSSSFGVDDAEDVQCQQM
jgi:DnaJ-class molecular chaperone